MNNSVTGNVCKYELYSLISAQTIGVINQESRACGERRHVHLPVDTANSISDNATDIRDHFRDETVCKLLI